MKAKHTPGPWVISDTVTEHSERDGLHYSVGNDAAQWAHVASVHSEPDARLIAAAPDMLLALQTIVGLIEIGETSQNIENVARAAIARAKEV